MKPAANKIGPKSLTMLTAEFSVGVDQLAMIRQTPAVINPRPASTRIKSSLMTSLTRSYDYYVDLDATAAAAQREDVLE